MLNKIIRWSFKSQFHTSYLRSSSSIRYLTSTSIPVRTNLKDADILSQDQMNLILGNDIIIGSQKDIESGEKKYSQESIIKKDLFYNMLPVKNEIYPICVDPEGIILEETANQNIYSVLNLQLESSYQDYTQALQTFRREDQLYGDLTSKKQITPSDLYFVNLLTEESIYLAKLRKQSIVNISIPGTIEVEDPRNFMELRPIQQFRHTPLVPISDKAMQKHKEMLQRYHRNQMVFEVSTETVLNWLLFFGAASIGGYLIYTIMQAEQEKNVAYSRFKYNRKKGGEDAPSFRI